MDYIFFQHLFEHLHLQPREAHGADFSRVRMWALNGWFVLLVFIVKCYFEHTFLSLYLINYILNILCLHHVSNILIIRVGHAWTFLLCSNICTEWMVVLLVFIFKVYFECAMYTTHIPPYCESHTCIDFPLLS